MLTIGRHLIAEFYCCDPRRIDDLEYMRAAMLAAAGQIGATVVAEAFHKFAPQGVSGTVVIAESHLSVHTWPDRAYVAVDIYTCGGLDPRPGFQYLAGQLGAEHARVQEILRGLPEDLRDTPLLPGDVQVITQMTESLPVRFEPAGTAY